MRKNYFGKINKIRRFCWLKDGCSSHLGFSRLITFSSWTWKYRMSRMSFQVFILSWDGSDSNQWHSCYKRSSQRIKISWFMIFSGFSTPLWLFQLSTFFTPGHQAVVSPFYPFHSVMIPLFWLVYSFIIFIAFWLFHFFSWIFIVTVVVLIFFIFTSST